MSTDDPPFLPVGTEVSAKYKGAFCEAKVRKVVRSVKCKVSFKIGGSAIVPDDHIRGATLRVGTSCEAKHPDKKEFLEANITKIQDCSQYTVVFDDGDITTLRRTALCLKSGRHFAESETLDQLPLTHPEHFGNPVIGGRKGRRSRQTHDASSDEDLERGGNSGTTGSGAGNRKGTGGASAKKPVESEADIGKVVCVELGDKKHQAKKDNWFPGLVVAPTAQDTVRIRIRDEYLVRSFKDGRYFTVPKKEASPFTREIGARVDSHTLRAAVDKALQFLDQDELPPHWDRDLLFHVPEESSDSDSDDALSSDSSDDEPREEKDHFVAQLYKFMDDRGTPINKAPAIGNKDLDLYKLFKVVHKLGGYNRVTNQNQWKTLAMKFNLGHSGGSNLVKQAYKKYLHSFEEFYRKLGCTMVNHPRGHRARHNKSGRSLIRDRDRAVPVKQEPKPPATSSASTETKTETIETSQSTTSTVSTTETKKESETVKIEVKTEENLRPTTPAATTTNKRETKVKEEKHPTNTDNKDKVPVKEETPAPAARTKSIDTSNTDRPRKGLRRDPSVPSTPNSSAASSATSQRHSSVEEGPILRGKRGRKRKEPGADPSSTKQSDQSLSQLASSVSVNVGDKLRVYYGPTHESKVTYEAKVLEVSDPSGEIAFLVHYTGWNTRYDEWIKRTRIAENLSWTGSRAKRHRESKDAKAGKTTQQQTPTRRQTSTARSTTSSNGNNTTSSAGNSSEIPAPARSSTPSSIASSGGGGSGNKSPGAARRGRPAAEMKRRSRRTSTHTDAATDSGSDEEQCPVPPPTRPSRNKTKTTTSVPASSVTPDRAESDDEPPPVTTPRVSRPRRTAATKSPKTPTRTVTPRPNSREKVTPSPAPPSQPGVEVIKVEPGTESEEAYEEDHLGNEQPRGRNFDLNEIRSELKGFDKACHSSSSSQSKTPPTPTPPVPISIPLTKPVVSPSSVVSPSNTEISPSVVESGGKTSSLVLDDDFTERLSGIKTEPIKSECKTSSDASPSSSAIQVTTTPNVCPTTSAGSDEDIYEFKEPDSFDLEIRTKRESRPLTRAPPSSSPTQAPSQHKAIAEKEASEEVKKRFRRTIGKKMEPLTLTTRGPNSSAPDSDLDEDVNAPLSPISSRLFDELPDSISDDEPLFTYPQRDYDEVFKAASLGGVSPTSASCTISTEVPPPPGDSPKSSVKSATTSPPSPPPPPPPTTAAASPEPEAPVVTTSSTTEPITTTPTSSPTPIMQQQSAASPISSTSLPIVSPPAAPIQQRTPSPPSTPIPLPSTTNLEDEEEEEVAEEEDPITEAIQRVMGEEETDDEEETMELINPPPPAQPPPTPPQTQVIGTSSSPIPLEPVLPDKPELQEEILLTNLSEISDPSSNEQQQQQPLISDPTPAIVPTTVEELLSTEHGESLSSDDEVDEQRLVIATADPEAEESDSSLSSVVPPQQPTRSTPEPPTQPQIEPKETVAEITVPEPEPLPLPEETRVDSPQIEVPPSQLSPIVVSLPSESPNTLPIINESNETMEAGALRSLLCEETIPGSPCAAPLLSSGEQNEPTTERLEMPFASAPGSECASPKQEKQEQSSIPIASKLEVNPPLISISAPEPSAILITVPPPQSPSPPPPPPPLPPPAPPAAAPAIPIVVDPPPVIEPAVVPVVEPLPPQASVHSLLENTPPTTPDSVPGAGAGGDASSHSDEGEPPAGPSGGDGKIENASSNSALTNNTKAAELLIEEDSILTVDASSLNIVETVVNEATPVIVMEDNLDNQRGDGCSSPPKKRRRNRRRSVTESAESCILPKRVKRAAAAAAQARNCAGGGSDSDATSDASQHIAVSTPPSASGVPRDSQPRASKYNFYAELDPNLDSNQRIAILQQNLQELKKCYLNEKAELATIDRRRKKLRRREREEKAAKQEVSCSG